MIIVKINKPLFPGVDIFKDRREAIRQLEIFGATINFMADYRAFGAMIEYNGFLTEA